MTWLSFILVLFGVLHASNYKFEGIYPEPDGERRFFLAALFLPYNPHILALNNLPDAAQKCLRWWPKGVFFSEAAPGGKYDFLWIESEGAELEIFHPLSDLVEKATAIYTSTHFQDHSYQNLRLFLELSGFTLISHWYNEGEQGHALFIHKQVFDAAMRTLNCTPKASDFKIYPISTRLERFFRLPEIKSNGHTLDGIDFIYMINLDERPQKFSKTAGGLHRFGINPYRFSAVNGWKLSIDAINQLGVKFFPGMLDEKYMGTTYVEREGVQYRSNELIQEDGRTYFSMGLSQGSIGIVLSHLSVLQDAYDSGYQTIWVMEDDVEAIEDPRQISDFIRNLDAAVGHWDILFTDTDTKDANGNHVPCRSLAARPNFYTETLDTFLHRFYPVGKGLARVGMRYGAYSMIIRRSGMKKILNHFKTFGIFLPYDMDFWLIPEIKMYTVDRDIVSHAVGAPTDNNYPNFGKE